MTAKTDETQVVTISLGKSSFSMALDPARMSQGHIRDALKRGLAYEPVTTEIITRILRPGDAVADCGAHVGYFALLAAALVGPSGKVFAFEPEQENLAALRANVARNGFSQISVIAEGVSDVSGTATFSLNRDNDGGHALWDVGQHFANPQSKAAPETVTIALTTLDEALKDAPKLRLVKMDVEGAETKALKGGAQTILAARVPFVICEINILALHFMQTTEMELRKLMYDAGYESFGLFDGDVMAGAAMAVRPLRPNLLMGQEGVYNILFATPEGVRALTG